jgi:hypothetical protein
MSLLAPLYIAGLVALSLPILFHLIRRAPQGRQAFSSLMFLSPSPPRLTRRSRLTNIVLLLLRAAALALLALAFARPFFQQRIDGGVRAADGRRVAILVDTSASMRRGDLWEQAKAQAGQVLADLGPADEVGLFFFDRRVRPAMTFAEWNELEPGRRQAVLRGRLGEAAPTWAATHAGEALATVADLLAEAEGSRQAAGARGRQLVLISDLQQGGHVEALQGHQWPEHVMLEVRTVAPKASSTNASLQLVTGTGDGPGDAAVDPTRLRVRVTNQPDSGREQFSLAWANAHGPLAGVEPVKVYVPPGRSQVARLPRPGPDRPQADRVVLSGDDADFDNTLYVVPPRKESVRVFLAGEDAADDVKGMRYYFERAVAETPGRSVEVAARAAAEALTEAELLGARLVVVAGGISDERAAVIRRFAEGGGDVLWVLRDAEGAGSLATLMGVPSIDVQEAPARDFALIGRVDPDDPLFSPFADARLADFTKIHFWKHRRVTLPPDGTARVLAAFDNGDPFLIEQPVGRGRLVIATSGWHPADSQLALSTKFVPLIDGFVRPRDGGTLGGTYAVGEPIPVPKGTAGGEAARAATVPDGRKIAIGADATAFDAADVPGVYRLTIAGDEIAVAVNVAPDESRTAPLAVEELARWGARLGDQPAPEEIVTRERQLRRMELEGRQKAWRWLIVGVLVLLAAETALAGGLARRARTQQVTT